ncbi:MAG: ABC transporter permease [Verrucomicrobia bacterium]|nr:MAG: ABC transporter permease [Verrucomicrobiota bacterium]
MLKVLKYSFHDLNRSRWSAVYLLFYLALGSGLLFLNNDLSRAVVTLLNVVIVLTPLIGTVLGITWFNNASEFTELLLAQPIRRTTIILGQYLGLSLALSFSLVVGLGLPFLAYGLIRSTAIFEFLLLLGVGVLLSFIFVGLAFAIALTHENRVKGFGYAILAWLFFAVLYDGLFLIALVSFSEYPLERFALIATFGNPIDLSRILILLKLDISALMGYTGAVFARFFGTPLGMTLSLTALLAWCALPLLHITWKLRRKDF